MLHSQKGNLFIKKHIHILACLFKENQQSELNLKFQGFPLFIDAAQDKLILLDQRDKIGRFSKDKKSRGSKSTEVVDYILQMHHQVYGRIVRNKMLYLIPTASDEDSTVVDPIHLKNIKWYQCLVRSFDQEKNNIQAQQKKKTVVDPIHLKNIKWYQCLVRSFDQEKNNIQAQQKKKMVKSSSCLENEPCCSKSCKKNIDSLNSKITKLTDKLSDRENMLFHYKAGLAQVEARLAEHRNRELKYCFQIASKDLDNLLESQRSDKNKEGLGYSAVPPPFPAQVYSPPKKDMSWTGLPEFADDTIIDYSMPSLAI
nr:hypothetical protein [Tanacetum cinerariifolium]